MSDNKTEKNEKSKEKNPSGLFYNQKALDRLQSPDDLEKYLHISTPSAWIMIVACATVMLGFLCWCIWGTSVESTTVKGVKSKNYVVAFADAETAIQIEEGDEAFLDGNMYNVDTVVLSSMDKDQIIDEYSLNPLIADVLVSDNKSYPVLIDIGNDKVPDNKPLDVAITLDRKSPISLLFGI